MPTQSRAPFDPLAIVAIIASFFFGPVGLFLAFSSLGRARKNGASPALSLIALMVGLVATAMLMGGGALLSTLFSGVG